MSGHERMKDEVVLLALGLTPDVPTSAVEEHVNGCDECRALMQDVLHVAGHLPEALNSARPPAHLRDNIIRLATNDHGRDPVVGRFAGRSARWRVVRSTGEIRARLVAEC